jgi:hypothetical protein
MINELPSEASLAAEMTVVGANAGLRVNVNYGVSLRFDINNAAYSAVITHGAGGGQCFVALLIEHFKALLTVQGIGWASANASSAKLATGI